MDFTLSEEHEMLRQAVREFTDGVVRPAADAIDRDHAIGRLRLTAGRAARLANRHLGLRPRGQHPVAGRLFFRVDRPDT